MYAKTSCQIVLFQVNQLKLQTQTALMGQFNHPKRSIVSQHGALTALIALGPQVLESCVWPQMDKYLNSLEAKFNEKGQIVMSNGHSLQDRPTPHSNKRQDLALIWGTFLLAARSMLHSATKGQLISKCPFGVKTSSKKPTKLFLDFCPEFFCTFLGASWKLFGASCRLPRFFSNFQDIFF
jgi:hypothetical protein